MKRRALGKGLGSLIPAKPRGEAAVALQLEEPAPQEAHLEIDVDRIRPNKFQPRGGFDEEAIVSLAESLKDKGVLQPVVVRPARDGRYDLVAGERRWRAAQRAGLLKIPAIVRTVPDEELLEYALVENLQRQDLNPMEEARAYRTLIEDLGLTQQQVAERVGKQRATVANLMRLLSLAPPVQERVRAGSLSMGHARALAAVADPRLQTELAERAIREGLSVRQLELLASRVGPREAGPSPKRRAMDPNVTAAEKALQTALGTKVVISKSGARGRIELHFYSDEELDRLYTALLRAGKAET